MSNETTFVFGLIAVAAGLMASNRIRFDIVALLVVLALMLSGVLTVGEALSGFGNPVGRRHEFHCSRRDIYSHRLARRR